MGLQMHQRCRMAELEGIERHYISGGRWQEQLCLTLP